MHLRAAVTLTSGFSWMCIIWGKSSEPSKGKMNSLRLPVWLSRHRERRKVHSLPIRALGRLGLWTRWKGTLGHSSLLCKCTFGNRTWEGHTIKIPFGPIFYLFIQTEVQMLMAKNGSWCVSGACWKQLLNFMAFLEPILKPLMAWNWLWLEFLHRRNHLTLQLRF